MTAAAKRQQATDVAITSHLSTIYNIITSASNSSVQPSTGQSRAAGAVSAADVGVAGCAVLLGGPLAWLLRLLVSNDSLVDVGGRQQLYRQAMQLIRWGTSSVTCFVGNRCCLPHGLRCAGHGISRHVIRCMRVQTSCAALQAGLGLACDPLARWHSRRLTWIFCVMVSSLDLSYGCTAAAELHMRCLYCCGLHLLLPFAPSPVYPLQRPLGKLTTV